MRLLGKVHKLTFRAPSHIFREGNKCRRWTKSVQTQIDTCLEDKVRSFAPQYQWNRNLLHRDCKSWIL